MGVPFEYIVACASYLTTSDAERGNDMSSGGNVLNFLRDSSIKSITSSSVTFIIILSALHLGGDSALYQKLKLVKETIDENPGGPYKKILRESHGMVI